MKELFEHRAREKSLDCKTSQDKVLSYIRASAKERAAQPRTDVVDAFAHIYWCINTQSACGALWYTLKFLEKHPVPGLSGAIVEIAADAVIRKRRNKEIKELLALWEPEINEFQTNALFEDLPPAPGDTDRMN